MTYLSIITNIMNRRRFLFTAGAGTAAVLSGCTDSEDSGNSDTNDDELTQEEIIEQQIEQAAEEVTKDGQYKYTPNLHVINIEEISKDTLSIELNFPLNPVADYDIQVHVTPITMDHHGEWKFVPTPADGYTVGGTPEYNDRTHEWEVDSRSARLEYVFDSGLGDDLASAVTVPKEGFTDVSKIPGEPFTDNVESGELGPTDPHGIPLVLDFDLDAGTIPMYEPFVFTFTWEGGNTLSDREGDVITNTPQIIRTGEDTFVYPWIKDDDNNLIHPSWDGNGIHDDVWEGYDYDEVYVDNLETSGDVLTADIVRLSRFSRFKTDQLEELAQEGDRKDNREYSAYGGEFLGRNSSNALSAPLQHAWHVSYEIDDETLDEAISIADAHKPDTGNGARIVYELSNAPEVLNHPVIEDVASQLANICDRMGATEPTDQIRVIADFVQYIDHKWELGDIPKSDLNLAPGTAHPVQTLHRGVGDCKDYTVLGNALLEQDPFNLSTHVAYLEDVTTFVAHVDEIGHVTSAVPLRELEIDELVEDDVFDDPPLSGVEGTFDVDGEEYLYIEMSGPFPLGYVWDQWDAEAEDIHEHL